MQITWLWRRRAFLPTSSRRAPSTRASTRGARSTSTTAAAASTRRRRSRSTSACCARRVFGNPHSANPTSSAATALVERGARGRAALLPRGRERVRRASSPPNASGALRLVGEAYPFAPAGRFLATVRQPQLGERHPRVRPREGRRTAYVPLEAPDLRVDDGVLVRPARRRRPGAATCSPIPAQSNFSGVKHPLEWIAPAQERGWDVLVDGAAFVPTNRLDLSVWHAGLRRDLLLQDVRLSDRPGRAAGAPRRAGAAASGPGSPAAPSSRRTSGRPGRAARRPRRGSRTARSTTSASRRSRSGCATSSGSGSTRSRGASRRSGRGCSAELRRLRHADGEPGGPHLRPGDVGRPRRHDRVQLPAPGRARGRRALRRPRRRGPRHLAADRMLLQPGSGRGRVRALTRRARRCRVRRRHDPRRLHRAHRHALGRRRPRLARARQQLRRRPPLPARSPTRFRDLERRAAAPAARLAC